MLIVVVGLIIVVGLRGIFILVSQMLIVVVVVVRFKRCMYTIISGVDSSSSKV